MCGRYTLRYPDRIPLPAEVLREIDERREELLAPRYNIAPSQSVLVLGRNAEGAKLLAPAIWGFRPHWLPADRKAAINARAESVRDKPMFRSAFRKGRCLVAADGWYEWQARSQGPKQPHFFRRGDDAVFWFAGLAATNAQGERTAAILTTDANAVSQPVHGRMPAVLPDDDAADTWLDPDAGTSTLQDLLGPVSSDALEVYPVSREVNRPLNDGPELIGRLAEG